MSIHGGAPNTGGRVLAPSRSTVYVSNLPFSLTNNDLTKVFEKFGKIVKVTVVCNRESHKSKGVAFLLFLNREDALSCVKSTNGCQMFGRTLKASIAKDNGRAPEFIRRKEYPDKSRCYQCGEYGHLSYKCPKNLLGDREPPKKKPRKRKNEEDNSLNTGDNYCLEEDKEDQDDEEDFEDESLSAAIQYQQELRLAEEFQSQITSGGATSAQTDSSTDVNKKIKIKKSAYFSDEEELSE